MFLFRSNNKLSNIDLSYLIITFLIIIYFTITYSPPIISLWESAEIYLDFLPIDKRLMVLSISEDPVTSGHFNNSFGYAFLIVSRYISDIFGNQLSIIRIPSTIYGLFALALFFIIIKKWFDFKLAILSILLLATNQYFLIFQHLLLPQMATLLMMFFLIFRFQKFNEKQNLYTIILLGLAFCLCSLNYITGRLFAVSIIFYYLLIPNNLHLLKISTFKDIFSKKRSKNFLYLSISIVLIFTILYPGNIFLFFSKEFIMPSTRIGEYNPGFFEIINNISLNFIHLIREYILNFSTLPSDILIHRTFRIENILVIFFSLIGLIFLIKNHSNKVNLFLIFVFSINLIFPLMSTVDYSKNHPYSMSVHRLFFLIPFILLIAAIGFMEIFKRIKNNKIKNIIFFLFCIFLLVRFVDLNINSKNFLNSLNAKEIDVNKKPLSNNIEKIDDETISRLDKHYNQIYFYKLAKLIKNEISSYDNSADNNVIFVDEKLYTPANYAFGGGDIPRKGYPYYFKIFLSIYLSENDLNVKYLVETQDIKQTRIQKALQVIERFKNNQNTPDQYPRNLNQEKILRFLILILDQVEKIDYIQNKISKIKQGNTLFDKSFFGQRYFYKPTYNVNSNIILATNKEELSILKNNLKNAKIILKLK